MQLLLLLLLECTKTERRRCGQGRISSHPMSSCRANGRRWDGFCIEDVVGCGNRSARHADDRWMPTTCTWMRIVSKVGYPCPLGPYHIWRSSVHRNGGRALDRRLEGTRGWLLRALRLKR